MYKYVWRLFNKYGSIGHMYICINEDWSKITGAGFVTGKLKCFKFTLQLSPSKYNPSDIMLWCYSFCHFFTASVVGLFQNGLQHLVISVESLHPQNLFPFRMTLSLGKRKKLQGTKSGKSDGKPLGCSAWPKTPWQPGPLDMAHCCCVVSRYQNTLLWWNMNICGIREEIHDAPDPPHEGKWTGLSWFLTCLGFFGQRGDSTAHWDICFVAGL
jgi:hypothetical protein